MNKGIRSRFGKYFLVEVYSEFLHNMELAKTTTKLELLQLALESAH